MLNRQNFSYENVAIRKFLVLHIFKGIFSLSGFVKLCWNMEFNFECPILDNEDPPEDNELPDPSRPLSKVILVIN